MRALYLFLGEVMATDRRRDRPRDGHGRPDDEPLRPIADGAFARWMAAVDRATPAPSLVRRAV